MGCNLSISELFFPHSRERRKTVLFKVSDVCAGWEYVCVGSVSSISITACFDRRLSFSFVYSFRKRDLHVIAKLHLGNCDRSNHTVDDFTGKTSSSALDDASRSGAGGSVAIPHEERRDQRGVGGLFRGFPSLEAK